MSGEVIRTQRFVDDAAEFIVGLARAAIAERGEFRVALSGGNTPRPVYHKWAELGRDIGPDRLLITFGDERCVPPDHPDSNYRMARECLLDPAGIPNNSVLRMRGEIGPEAAADEYERQLKAAAQQRHESIYRHDLMLLGMGDDGHTASLFPGTAALNEQARNVVANFVPKLDAWRLTMTYPLINESRCVCFLINAAKNPELIGRVIEGDPEYPAARVKPASGRLVWILGEAA
jgi:6-phosphogluconolactonase